MSTSLTNSPTYSNSDDGYSDIDSEQPTLPLHQSEQRLIQEYMERRRLYLSHFTKYSPVENMKTLAEQVFILSEKVQASLGGLKGDVAETIKEQIDPVGRSTFETRKVVNLMRDTQQEMGAGLHNVESRIGNVEARLGGLETAMVAQQEDMQMMMGEVGGITSVVGTITQDVGGMMSEVNRIGHDVGTVGREVGGLRGEVGSAAQGISAVNQQMGPMEARMGQLEGRMQTFQGNLGGLKSDVDGLKADVGQIRSDVNTGFAELKNLMLATMRMQTVH